MIINTDYQEVNNVMFIFKNIYYQSINFYTKLKANLICCIELF